MAAAFHCYNCGAPHDIASCVLPNLHHSCAHCHITPFDGAEHLTPCTPVNSIRRNIYGAQPIDLFKMKLANQSDWFHIFNKHTWEMDMVDENSTFLSPATEELVEFATTTTGEQVASFSATSLKRSVVWVAVFTARKWRFRYRIVVTDDKGVLCFPIRTSFDSVNGRHIIPEGFRYNTTLIIGIGSTADKIEIRFKVFAKTTGVSDSGIESFYGSAVWQKTVGNDDEVKISPELCREYSAHRVFNPLLYERNRPTVKANQTDESVVKSKFKRAATLHSSQCNQKRRKWIKVQ